MRILDTVKCKHDLYTKKTSKGGILFAHTLHYRIGNIKNFVNFRSTSIQSLSINSSNKPDFVNVCDMSYQIVSQQSTEIYKRPKKAVVISKS